MALIVDTGASGSHTHRRTDKAGDIVWLGH